MKIKVLNPLLLQHKTTYIKIQHYNNHDNILYTFAKKKAKSNNWILAFNIVYNLFVSMHLCMEETKGVGNKKNDTKSCNKCKILTIKI